MVRNEVRRLHKLTEARAMRSEWEVLSPGTNGRLQSVFAGMKATTMMRWDDEPARDKAIREEQVRKETELRIAEELRGGDEMVERLFGCQRAGIVKRREIAARLGVSVVEVTNCRKRLDRKVDELEKAGYPGWVIEEWKRR
jgi:hypothetical protein